MIEGISLWLYCIEIEMSQTSTVLQEELELTSIIELAQTKLSRNFTLLLSRLNHHDSLLAQIHSSLNTHTLALDTLSRQANSFTSKFASIELELAQTTPKITQLEQWSTAQANTLTQHCSQIACAMEANSSLRNDYTLTHQNHQEQLVQLRRHIGILALDNTRLNEELTRKENKAEAERIYRETELLKGRNEHIESELKIANHKIEKMEILNMKAERTQAKKDDELIKEIEERVRKELKQNYGRIAGTPQVQSISTIVDNGPAVNAVINYISNGLVQRSEPTSQENTPLPKPNNRRTSIIMEESIENKGMEPFLEKWGDRIKQLEGQMKDISDNVRFMGKRSSKQRKESASEGIKDKVNEIRPELVKLWAKMDTIEDKLTFGERKLEEKLRAVSELTTALKENSTTRLEEKVKNLQTEVFSSFKDLRSALECKLNQSDHDKALHLIEARLLQISQQLALKSDKLEVKKALLFLEGKIKEIILVISQDEENQKDALLTRKQLKCIACDKEVEQLPAASGKSLWEGIAAKAHPPELLGRFGMTGFGSLAKKIKRLEGKDLPVLQKRSANHSFQLNS